MADLSVSRYMKMYTFKLPFGFSAGLVSRLSSSRNMTSTRTGAREEVEGSLCLRVGERAVARQ